MPIPDHKVMNNQVRGWLISVKLSITVLWVMNGLGNEGIDTLRSEGLCVVSRCLGGEVVG
jgi:hypothetical protein